MLNLVFGQGQIIDFVQELRKWRHIK